MSDRSERRKPVLLLILDGWGHREETADNAIALAATPNWDRLLAQCPHTLIHTEGRFVGLPDGQMGNSEVGHMNIGAGRIVYQDLTRIDAAIEDGSFFDNPELLAACAAPRLHVFGLLSPGGVHSHETHLLAMLDLGKRAGVREVFVHAFLDGRDTPPRSAADSISRLQAHCESLGNTHIASLSGRYYAMDRDKRWERVQPAWQAIVEADAARVADSAAAGLQAAYDAGENDEFVVPTAIAGGARIEDGDAVVFMNFRADRARQLTAAFVDPGFNGFPRARVPALARFVCLSQYDAKLPAPVAFPPADLNNTLGEVVASAGRKQLRIAETEKYAHVTFFFNGGREEPFAGEDRILIPSPKVATYDLQPEMSCPQLTAELVADITAGRHDLIVCNIANPDMVGHTGVLTAAIAAVQVVDTALGAIRAAVESVGGALLVTADHGNLELMRDPETGQPHTAHTVGPVPLVLCGVAAGLRSGGALRDLAPTVLEIMQLDKPAQMTGQSLLTPV